LFLELSRQFGWTPDQIRWLTLQELEAYTEGNQKYHEHVAPLDISLERIRRALFGVFGIKEADRQKELEYKIAKSATQVSRKAFDAWMAAGMPSPAAEWIRNYKDG
jgi:hypothetical protein